ncbi:hypothetical protein B0H13DRAFT_2035291 [Mycena leptocephala]|nr:hypothetical protein B0H13DRAFT_2035291 [Mycena leptocephala]
MASLKSELRITVVDDFDWPALQESSILTPCSLCPRDVTQDGEEALSASHLTPNSISGKFAWADRPRTPTTSRTFGFPLSPALSSVSKFSPDAQSPLEKHKRRLRRYTTAESVLAGLPTSSTLSPSQLRANAVHYATRSVAARIREARQSVRAVRHSGLRDSTRWMAEHRLTALESLRTELASPSVTQYGDGEDDARRRGEDNLVRFLSVGRGQGLVPVFTRANGRRPPMPTPADTERRCMTGGSPMKLQSDAMPVSQTPRSEWPWETRVRSDSHATSSLALSTPTSATFSPIEPATPLTEEEEEDEFDYEDYPIFTTDSARSSPSDWPPRRAPPSHTPLHSKVQAAPLPPPTTLTPDATYAWLSDPSTWASPSAWHGDGWEVAPTSASSTAFPSSTSSPTSFTAGAPSPSLPPRTPTLPPSPAHRFWTRERHRRLPSLRPITEAARDAAVYAVKPLPPPPTPQTPQTPRTPHTPHTHTPRTPHTPQKKGRQFFAGLVRRMHIEPGEHDLKVPRDPELEREGNKLRKRGSVRSFASARSSQSVSLEDY